MPNKYSHEVDLEHSQQAPLCASRAALAMLLLTCLVACLLTGKISSQSVDKTLRIDCFTEPGSNQQNCESRGCIWDSHFDSSHPSIPLCYYPAGTGYSLSASGLANPYILLKKSDSVKNPYGADISPISVYHQNIGATLNVKIGVQGRYEPPVQFPRKPSTSSDSLRFTVADTNNLFTFQVKRASTGTNLWDTSIGGLLFADKFIQVATLLPTDKVYGFGEAIHQSLKHDFSGYTTWAMFARDEPPDSGSLNTKNLYGVHPFYICIEPDGKAHGVLILNSNAQEVTTGMGPHLIYKTIGGNVDLYFFPGPLPEDVVNQYQALIGTPFLPAYWALGFQLCRYGYHNLGEMQAAVSRTQQAGIPLDVTYADIDYMDRYKDFTTGSPWSGFPQYANDLHTKGLHIILIFDPAIQVDYDSFQRGINSKARFLEWPRQDQVPPAINGQYPMVQNTKIMLGVVWPDKHVAFPDFLDPSGATNKWWADEFTRYHSQLGFDGIWIDMNEPSNFGTNQEHPWYYDDADHPNIAPLFCPLTGADSTFDSPPYQTQAVYHFGNDAHLCSNTLCMLAKSAGGNNNLYDTKNLYGWSEARATHQALIQATGKRGAIISRSTFPSAGRWAGHWLGDNTARWEDLKTSVIGAMEFNFFGIPYVGSDICGFIGTTTEELCLRWQQMGAFHPFSRNHNTIGAPAQDPGVWPTVAAAAKKALEFRYHYLPYLYSLHFEASLNGHTVLRPLFFEFPQDTNTHTISYQFLWGAAFLVTPVLDQGATTVRAYFPNDVWYSISDFGYGNVQAPGFASLQAPTTSMIPIHVRGGYILPRQAPAMTTTAARINPFELLVAIKGQPGQAQGQLYWDDGETLAENMATFAYYNWVFKYTETSSTAQITLQRMHTASGLRFPTLDIIEILGYGYYPVFTSFTLDGKALSINTQTSTYSPLNKRLMISTARLIDLSAVNANQPSVLSWRHGSQIVD